MFKFDTPTLFSTMFYRAKELTSVVRFMSIIPIEFVGSPSWPSSVCANSIAKHSFSSATTWLIVGLLAELGDRQPIAISTTFQAELILKFLCNLVSTIFFISPLSSKKLTHWLMWVFSWDPSIAGRLVIISKRTTLNL